MKKLLKPTLPELVATSLLTHSGEETDPNEEGSKVKEVEEA